MDQSWIFGVLILLLFLVLFLSNDIEGFHRRGYRRRNYFPYYRRYDPSYYYNDEPDWYESPYVFFNRRPVGEIGNKAYWQCFELNKSTGVSNDDAYKLCRRYID